MAMELNPEERIVKVAVVQASTIFHSTLATLDKAEKYIARAVHLGAQLVVFPEAFVGGYPSGSNFGVSVGYRTERGKEEFQRYHASAIDVPGPEVDRLRAMAGKYSVYLVMGAIERDGYTLYSTVLFFNSHGDYLGKHRKMVLSALERIIWSIGDEPLPVFDTPLGKIGAAMSWENRMPVLRTSMYAKGIEIYCVPTADAGEEWLASMTHIAIEGGCFVLSANQYCQRADYAFSWMEENDHGVFCDGGSAIISPSGVRLVGPYYERQELMVTSLDLGEIARTKFDFDVVGPMT